MKWIKASEREPQYLANCHWRDENKSPISVGIAHTYMQIGKKHLIEWLDETECDHVKEIERLKKELSKANTNYDEEFEKCQEKDRKIKELEESEKFLDQQGHDIEEKYSREIETLKARVIELEGGLRYRC